MIEIEIVGDREVIARLREVSERVHAGLVRAITILGFKVEARAKDLVSGPMLQVRTGVGRSSINTEIADHGEGSGADATTGIGRAAPYMAILHQGVDHPWVITARGGALSFDWKGQHWFRKSVTHPAMAARPFLTSALHATEPEIAPTIAAEIAKEIAR